MTTRITAAKETTPDRAQLLVNFGRGNLLLKMREMKVSRIVSDSIIAL